MRLAPQVTLAGLVMLVMASAIFAASLIHRVNLLLLLFSLILSAFVIGLFLGRRQLRGVSVKRRVPSLVAAGQRWAGFLEAHNERRKGIVVGLHALESLLEDARVRISVAIPPVPPGSSVQARFSLNIPRRGIYQFRPTRLTSSYPFGFFRWKCEVPEQGRGDQVIVYPAIGELSLEACRRLGLAAAGDGRGVVGLLEGADEFRGVRDFRTGDPSRLIHWRSTARRGSLVVRELDPAASRNILLLLDLREQDSQQSANAVEEAVSFAATVVTQACRDPSLQLTMVVAGRESLVVRGLASSARMGAYLRALAISKGTTDSTAFSRAVRMLNSTDTRDRRLWIVTLGPPKANDMRVLARGGARGLSERIVLDATSEEFQRLWTSPPRAFHLPDDLADGGLADRADNAGQPA